jgi:hypothetical protein
MRGAPEGIVATHLANQSPRFLGDRRSSRLSVADLPGPKQPEALTVPADHGLRLNDDEGRAPAGPELGQPCPEESISGGQLRSLDRTLQDPELVVQSKDLKLKGRSGANQRPKET